MSGKGLKKAPGWVPVLMALVAVGFALAWRSAERRAAAAEAWAEAVEAEAVSWLEEMSR